MSAGSCPGANWAPIGISIDPRIWKAVNTDPSAFGFCGAVFWKKAARTNLEGGVKSPGRPSIALPPPKEDRDIFPSV